MIEIKIAFERCMIQVEFLTLFINPYIDEKRSVFKKNEIILKDGEIGEGFYILEEELAVVRDGLVLNEISQKVLFLASLVVF